MRVLRSSMILIGAAVLLYGVYGLLTAEEINQPLYVGEWLVGGVVLHDAVIAPAVFVLGWSAARTTTPRVRRVLAAVLVVAGTATLVAMPILLHGRVATR
jgi:hypothetical protein